LAFLRSRKQKHFSQNIGQGCGSGSWKWNLEAKAVKAVKLLWKRKHFEEISWKRKQNLKRLTLLGAGSESKTYSTLLPHP